MKALASASLFVLALAAPAAQANVRWGASGLVIEPEDGSYRLRFGGRLHYDNVRIDDDVTSFQDQSGFRRARLYLSGRIGKDWRFMVDRDVGGTSPGWKGLWASYSGIEHLTLKAGQFTAPFGLDELTGSNDTVFMERALPSALAPGLLLGVQASSAWKHGSVAVGYFGDPIDVEFGKTPATGRGVVGRVTWAPIHSARQVLHLGLAYETRDIEQGSAFRIVSAPETGLTRTTLFNTSNLINARALRRRGAEAAWSLGPVAMQAEAMRTDLQRTGFDEVHFDGWYLQAAWLLTGEQRRYNVARGSFGDVRPRHDAGALELAVRRSALDLETGFVTGGRGFSNTVGLNWYLTRNLRLMADYTEAQARPNKNGRAEDVRVFQVRAQIDY